MSHPNRPNRLEITNCIYCDKYTKGKNLGSAEHVFPESFISDKSIKNDYILPKPFLCSCCNSRLSKLNQILLNSPIGFVHLNLEAEFSGKSFVVRDLGKSEKYDPTIQSQIPTMIYTLLGDKDNGYYHAVGEFNHDYLSKISSSAINDLRQKGISAADLLELDNENPDLEFLDKLNHSDLSIDTIDELTRNRPFFNIVAPQMDIVFGSSKNEIDSYRNNLLEILNRQIEITIFRNLRRNTRLVFLKKDVYYEEINESHIICPPHATKYFLENPESFRDRFCRSNINMDIRARIPRDFNDQFLNFGQIIKNNKLAITRDSNKGPNFQNERIVSMILVVNEKTQGFIERSIANLALNAFYFRLNSDKKYKILFENVKDRLDTIKRYITDFKPFREEDLTYRGTKGCFEIGMGNTGRFQLDSLKTNEFYHRVLFNIVEVDNSIEVLATVILYPGLNRKPDTYNVLLTDGLYKLDELEFFSVLERIIITEFSLNHEINLRIPFFVSRKSSFRIKDRSEIIQPIFYSKTGQIPYGDQITHLINMTRNN